MKAVDAGGRLVSQHEYAEAFDFLADARGVATAAVLATVLRAPPASREVPEGLTMLIPVAGLFSISYWLFSHAEAARWQAFIRDKVGRALALGGSGALTVVAFLAVYREGAETAPFFQALFAGSADVLVPLACGIAAAAKASPPDSIAPSSRNVPPIAVAPPDTTRHVTTVTLEPNQGKEIKLRMRKGARADYSWSTDHGVVNVDAHGDAVGRPSSYHGYKRGSNVGADQGTLVAAFDGNHGWFWRNRGTTPITITLVTQGTYEAVIPPR